MGRLAARRVNSKAFLGDLTTFSVGVGCDSTPMRVVSAANEDAYTPVTLRRNNEDLRAKVKPRHGLSTVYYTHLRV